MKNFITFVFVGLLFLAVGCENKEEKESADTVTVETQDVAVLSEDASPTGASSDVVVTGD